MRITKGQLRQIIREAVSGRGAPPANESPERNSNWYPFARALDIGVLDLDNMAFDLGFDSWRDMDRSISPRRLARRDPAAFLAAARASSLRAEDMSDDAILGAAELPYEGR